MVLETAATLGACEGNIEINCSPSVNVTETQDCEIIAQNFLDEYDSCFTDFADDPTEKCHCIEDLDFDPVKKCKPVTNSVFSTLNKERNKCNTVFPECKSMIAEVLEVVVECSTCNCPSTGGFSTMIPTMFPFSSMMPIRMPNESPILMDIIKRLK